MSSPDDPNLTPIELRNMTPKQPPPHTTMLCRFFAFFVCLELIELVSHGWSHDDYPWLILLNDVYDSSWWRHWLKGKWWGWVSSHYQRNLFVVFEFISRRMSESYWWLIILDDIIVARMRDWTRHFLSTYCLHSLAWASLLSHIYKIGQFHMFPYLYNTSYGSYTYDS